MPVDPEINPELCPERTDIGVRGGPERFEGIVRGNEGVAADIPDIPEPAEYVECVEWWEGIR